MTKIKSSPKRILCVVLMLAMCLILPLLFSGCDSEQIESEDYSLSNYSVIANVTKDNDVKITEEFTVNFNAAMHGVTRYVPVHSTAYYKIGNKTVKKSYNLTITNRRVLTGACAKQGYDGDYYYFQLGSSSKTFSKGSSTNFKIEYTLSIPDNRLTDFDSFYYNILPFDWDVKITNASFVVNFEKAVSKEELIDKTHLYIGKVGSTSMDERLTYNFEDSQISGTISSLNAFEGVTVYTEFEKGYFGYNQASYWWRGVIALVVLGLIILWAFWSYRKSKVERNLVPTVEFKAPDGLTPAECGLILDGKVDNRDLTSMIVYWANKGYIKIVEKDKKVTLEKLKELTEGKHYEKTVFNGIFRGQTVVDVKDIVNFGEVASRAKSQLKVDLKHTNFESKSKNSRKLLATFAALIPAVATFLLWAFTDRRWGLIVAAADLLAISGACTLYCFAEDKKYFYSDGKTKFFKALAMLVPVVACVLVFVFAYEFYADRVVFILWAHLASILFMIMSAKVLSRTEISVERLGKIIGLKNYITSAEKDRLEMLVKETPTLFYDILPYAYVLNVTDEYCKMFEKIKIVPPAWFESDSLTNMDFFTGFYVANALNRSMAQVNAAVISPINNAGSIAKTVGKFSGGIGGGTKGGGFGGGGLGGGGGRGW